MNCSNCNSEVMLNYCPNCGQAIKLKRIDAHYIIHEIVHVLHFEKGILYTIRELLLHPGENVKEFIGSNRSRLVKPIIFIILTSLLYTIVNHTFHLEDGYVSQKGINLPVTKAIIKWVQDHYGYGNILMGLFIAMWTKLFFKSFSYNYFEILILLCFVIGMAMLIYSIFGVFQGITHIHVLQIGGIIGVLYCAWAIGQFFDKSKPVSYVKSLFAYLLGMISFFLLAVIIGVIADLALRH